MNPIIEMKGVPIMIIGTKRNRGIHFGMKDALLPQAISPRVKVPKVRSKMGRSDSHTHTLTPPPVGARLAQFREAWEGSTSDSWTLNIIRKGYLPEFISNRRPKLSIQPERFESARTPLKSVLLHISKWSLQLL